MNLWIVSALVAVALLGFVEAFLRFLNPYRLWSDAFDESSVIETHPARGWAQRKNAKFVFYHRFLSGTNSVHFNALGMHDSRDYLKNKGSGVLRIALFGDTCAAGYELPADQTIAAQLERQLSERLEGQRIEVMNASARNYCTAQLYQWYVDEVAEYKPDVVVYLFGSNHPRRNITLHESGKPVEISQAVFRLNSAGGIERIPIETPQHPNDMIHLDSNWRVRNVAGKTDRILYRSLRDNFHIVTFIDDWYYGKNRLRNLTDRSEIKDIEKRNPENEHGNLQAEMPYQWRLTEALLKKWAAAVKSHGARFIVTPFLTRYHVNADNTLQGGTIEHSLGFEFDRIPERRFLPGILKAIDVNYFDTYAFARNNSVNMTSHYLHPRYAYPTREGANFHAKALAEGVLSETTAKEAKV